MNSTEEISLGLLALCGALLIMSTAYRLARHIGYTRLRVQLLASFSLQSLGLGLIFVTLAINPNFSLTYGIGFWAAYAGTLAMIRAVTKETAGELGWLLVLIVSVLAGAAFMVYASSTGDIAWR